MYFWHCIVNNCVETSFLSFSLSAYLNRWLFVSAFLWHEFLISSTKRGSNIRWLLRFSSEITTLRFFYWGTGAKSACTSIDTCSGGACIKIAKTESTCIWVTCTGLDLIKGICVASTCICHVNTKSFEARVTKRADFRRLWIESSCTDRTCSACVRGTCIVIFCVRDACNITAVAVDYSEMHSQFFEILEVEGVRL